MAHLKFAPFYTGHRGQKWRSLELETPVDAVSDTSHTTATTIATSTAQSRQLIYWLSNGCIGPGFGGGLGIENGGLKGPEWVES